MMSTSAAALGESERGDQSPPPSKSAQLTRRKRRRETNPRTRTIFSQLKPPAVPVDEARRLLGNKGRNQIYELVKSGKIVAVRDGNKKMLILVDSCERYIAGLPRAELVEPAMLLAGKERARIEAAAATRRSPARRSPKPSVAASNARS
jgi:hypothetical protein